MRERDGDKKVTTEDCERGEEHCFLCFECFQSDSEKRKQTEKKRHNREMQRQKMWLGIQEKDGSKKGREKSKRTHRWK